VARSRIGIIGAGNVAHRHARVLSGFDDVCLAAVTDVVTDAARRLGDAYGVPVAPDLPALLGAGLDAVYICVPPFAHGAPEEAVLAAGLPMFVEKPIAVDREVAVRTARLVERHRAVTAVGHHWRYLRVVERARELLADRPVRLVSGAWLDKVPPVVWWSRRSRSGGPVVEQAAHVLDLARTLVGDVAEVTAVGNGTPPAVDGADVDSATAATLRFAAGAVGTLATTCALGWKQRAGLEVYADGLALAVGEDELVVRDRGGERRYPGDLDAARVAVDRAFVDAVRGIADDVRAPYGDALHTHLLALAIAEAAATGRRVAVPGGARHV
jgi:myo-inositol 2-dehydrogenase/D-chiro-inositol 1-dehydrogenase